MYSVSSEFKRAVRNPHIVVAKAEVWKGDQFIRELDVLSGVVDVDGRRSVKRTCLVNLVSQRPQLVTSYDSVAYSSITSGYATYAALSSAAPTYASAALLGAQTQVLKDDGVVPDDAFDVLAPFGNELRLWRGIRLVKELPLNYASIATLTYSALALPYPTYGAVNAGTTQTQVDELVPLGVFEIEGVRIIDGEAGISVEVAGSDRSTLIAKNAWTDPYAIASGTNVATAISSLLENRYDDVHTRFSTTSWTTPQLTLGIDGSANPWSDAQVIAAAAGYDLYFDGEGVAVFSPSSDYDDSTPVETYLENEEAMLLGISRSLSNEQTFNGVIATGEGTEAGGTIRADVWDDDPSSPTYYLGIFGKRPYFYSSPMILTQTQAVNAASALLSTLQGATENVEWRQIVDPSLDSGDVVAIQNEGTKVNRVLVIDRLSIPLHANSDMTAVARTVRALS
jgi:hypothetical protein